MLIGLILIYLLVRNQVYKKKMSMLASIAAVCLIPVGAYFINFTSPVRAVLYADGNGCLPDLSAYDHYVVAVRLENLDLKDTEGMRYFCALCFVDWCIIM